MKANQLRIGAYMQEFYTGEDGKLKNKDYFVLTTNVDHCFQKEGFEKKSCSIHRDMIFCRMEI